MSAAQATAVLLLLLQLACHVALVVVHARPVDVGQWFLVPSFAALGSAPGLCGPERPIPSFACNVTARANGYELRTFPDSVLVTTRIPNTSYEKAIATGLPLCQGYFRGANNASLIFDDPVPLLVRPVPEAFGFSLSLFLPPSLKLERAPVPISPRVQLVSEPAATFAVIGPFGGFPNERVFREAWERLHSMLVRDGVAYNDNTLSFVKYSPPGCNLEQKARTMD